MIGCFSSLVLLLTVGFQVWKQWQSGSSEGVSPGLFAGQITASIGFTTYSVMVADWVFVATNSFMLFIALLGVVITLTHQRRAQKAPAAPQKRGLKLRQPVLAARRLATRSRRPYRTAR